jgi:hypothetical protein
VKDAADRTQNTAKGATDKVQDAPGNVLDLPDTESLPSSDTLEKTKKSATGALGGAQKKASLLGGVTDTASKV